MTTPGFECESAREFVVFVTCGSLGEGRVPEFALVVPRSEAWTTASIELFDLREAGEPLAQATNLKACLGAADSFGFRADVSNDQQSCDSGILWLDDIAFR
jgi:hypothetical protein